MRRIIFLIAATALADTWQCYTVRTTGPNLNPATLSAACKLYGGSVGGTFTQSGSFSLQLWSNQTNAPVGSPVLYNASATGVCTASASPWPNEAPVWGQPTASYLNSDTVQWNDTVANILPVTATLPIIGKVIYATAPGNQAALGPVNFGVTPCQCFQADCSNPALPPGSCYTTCNCTIKCTCPIVIDTMDTGFHLTDVANGVTFRFFPNQPAERLSWTDPKYGNGWLALPDAQGIVTSGKELFGNITPQPSSENPNGFAALAVYDLPINGGNGNGAIDPEDSIYPKLRVWIDANQDGVSQPGELHTLAELGIARIALTYEWTPWVDTWGNEYRYEGVMWDMSGAQRTALFDVFLETAQ